MTREVPLLRRRARTCFPAEITRRANCSNMLALLLLSGAEAGMLGGRHTPRAAAPRAAATVSPPAMKGASAPPFTEAAVLPDGHEYLAGPVSMSCGQAYLEQRPDLALPRMVIVALDPPVTDESIENFLAFLDEVLMAGGEVPFSICWEVRGGAFPSMKQFQRVQQYLGQPGRTEAWDSRVQGNAAVITNRFLRGTARLMASIARPPQPSHVGSTAESALSWARDTCTEARDYTSIKKQRKR